MQCGEGCSVQRETPSVEKGHTVNAEEDQLHNQFGQNTGLPKLLRGLVVVVFNTGKSEKLHHM